MMPKFSHVNPFHATYLSLYPLKISENIWILGSTEKDQNDVLNKSNSHKIIANKERSIKPRILETSAKLSNILD